MFKTQDFILLNEGRVGANFPPSDCHKFLCGF